MKHKHSTYIEGKDSIIKNKSERWAVNKSWRSMDSRPLEGKKKNVQEASASDVQ